MYKSAFFTVTTFLTFVLLAVIVGLQYGEMKTYGLLHFMLQANP